MIKLEKLCGSYAAASYIKNPGYNSVGFQLSIRMCVLKTQAIILIQCQCQTQSITQAIIINYVDFQCQWQQLTMVCSVLRCSFTAPYKRRSSITETDVSMVESKVLLLQFSLLYRATYLFLYCFVLKYFEFNS